MRDDREWLRDILEAIERIEKHSSRGKRAFEEDELIQSWIVHYLQIIGETPRFIRFFLAKPGFMNNIDTSIQLIASYHRPVLLRQIRETGGE